MANRKNEPRLLRTIKWVFPRLEKIAPFLSDRILQLAFYVPVKYKVPEKEIVAAKESTLSSIKVAGRRIQIYSWGEESRPYILFVHGWAGRTTQFRKFIAPLTNEGYRVIGFDGPAHGRSEGRQTSILEFEEVLKAIFDKFGEPKAIITHSFGGAATLYSASQGLPVGMLINIATPYIAEEILKTYLRALNGSWHSAERLKSYVIKKSGKTFEEFTGLHSIRELKRPVRLLLVQDEDDKEVPIINAEELLKAYPSATIFRTKGLAHTRILKDESVIHTCLDFIKNGGQLI